MSTGAAQAEAPAGAGRPAMGQGLRRPAEVAKISIARCQMIVLLVGLLER